MKIDSTYMGIHLDSPIVVSACNLSENTDNIVKMEDAGAGAVVMFSLFEEQIRKEEWNDKNGVSEISSSFAGALGYSLSNEFSIGTDEYLEKIQRAKSRVAIPIIASLNGITNDGWIDYSALIEEAGADGIEMNIFFVPGNMAMSSSEVEHRYLNIIDNIKRSVKIPVAVKLSPYFSAMGNISIRMQSAGADALVLFNRFYQPDFDINQLTITNDLHYSDSSEIRLPLLWIALLYGKVDLSLAANTGVESAIEVIKYILAGADVVMTASSLYKNGISYLRTLNDELQDWMYKMNFESIESFKGMMSQQHQVDPTSFQRNNYIKILSSVK